MLLQRLLSDTSGQVLSDAWTRPVPYRPRHGRPPIAVRTARMATMALGHVRERHLGGGSKETLATVRVRPPRMS